MAAALDQQRKAWQHNRVKLDEEQKKQDFMLKTMEQPGPGKYVLPSDPKTPKWSLGRKVNVLTKAQEDYHKAVGDPAPGEYGPEFAVAFWI